MVAWPENETENWNDPMAEFVHTGHNADGTHKWTPSVYEGGESVTFGNGIICKQGVTILASGGQVTFETPFPNGLTSVTATPNGAAAYGIATATQNSDGFLVYHNVGGGAAHNIHWQAWGY